MHSRKLTFYNIKIITYLLKLRGEFFKLVIQGQVCKQFAGIKLKIQITKLKIHSRCNIIIKLKNTKIFCRKI